MGNEEDQRKVHEAFVEKGLEKYGRWREINGS